MGIERFFSSIHENKITNMQSSFSNILETKISTNNLYIDFNSIIYITSFKVIADLNYILYQIIANKITNNKKVSKLLDIYDVPINILTLDTYISYYTEDKTNSILIDKIKEYIINILTNYIEPDNLKLLYIAIDGVPSKAKMIEQKKRRYIGGIINEIKKYIFKKHEKELKNEKNRYMYETNKIIFNRNLISPGTKFMDDLNNELKSDLFLNIIKQKCINLHSYIFSGIYEPGEGEKKIVDYIYYTYNTYNSSKNTHMIYSPDSDVPLLALILNIKNMKILRHNQQKHNYDVVDIDLLSENIYRYVLDGTKPYVPDKQSIIRDIVLLLTIFGNDFIPKIESVSVKTDFDKLIDNYISVLKNFKLDKGYTHIITNKNNKNNKLSINFPIFLEIIKTLQIDEGGNLQHIYIQNNYQNYNKLKKILDTTNQNFVKIIQQFLNNLRQFNLDIKSLNIDELIKKWDLEKIFIGQLIKLTNFGQDNRLTNDEFIELYFNHYKTTNKYPIVYVEFKKYRKTIKDAYYSNKLDVSLDNIDPNLKITEYDKEIFKFDNLLDEYQEQFNSYSLDLGKVYIDTTRYMWVSEKITNSIDKYYRDFFKSDDINLVVEEYIKGLMWVFEYYFNNFSIKENRENAHIWVYPYVKAPLLKQIYRFLKTKDENYVNELSENVFNQTVPMENYFNCYEHLMYTSPAPLIKDVIPQEYISFVEKSGYYPDLDSLINKMQKNKTNDLIDCKGSIFLTKCELKLLKHIDSFEEDTQNLINPLRKIKLKKINYKYNIQTNVFTKIY